jgi:hypothetical protein
VEPVPGLLQTDPYTEAVITQGSWPEATDADVKQVVEIRRASCALLEPGRTSRHERRLLDPALSGRPDDEFAVVYLEIEPGGLSPDRRSDLGRYSLIHDQLCGLALDERESVERITEGMQHL